MPPAKKKIKKEEEEEVVGDLPDAAAAQTKPPVATADKPGDDAGSVTAVSPPSSSAASSDLPVPANMNLFEFKFTNTGMDDDEFQANEVEGRLHMAFFVDETTGVLTVPTVPTQVKGWIKWPLSKDQYGKSRTLEEPIRGRVSPGMVTQNGSTTRYSHHSKNHVLRLGYALNPGDNSDRNSNTALKRIDMAQVKDNKTIDYELISDDSMESFAAKAGGEIVMLSLMQKPHCKNWRPVLNLYTVISELRPGQDPSSIVLADKDKKPDWDRLKRLVSNHPSTEKFAAGSNNRMAAVIAEYKRFLALKITKKAENSSKKFAPSPDVDLIWHLHLVFTEQYQQDVLAFANELKAEPFVVPHCPFLAEDSKALYEATLRGIKDKKLEKIIGKKVDMSFWPPAYEVFAESEEEGCMGCG